MLSSQTCSEEALYIFAARPQVAEPYSAVCWHSQTARLQACSCTTRDRLSHALFPCASTLPHVTSAQEKLTHFPVRSPSLKPISAVRTAYSTAKPGGPHCSDAQPHAPRLLLLHSILQPKPRKPPTLSISTLLTSSRPPHVPGDRCPPASVTRPDPAPGALPLEDHRNIPVLQRPATPRNPGSWRLPAPEHPWPRA